MTLHNSPLAVSAPVFRRWSGHRDSVVMLGCAMVGFSSLYLTQSLGPTLHALHGLTLAQCASLLTATTVGLALASPLAGRLVHRLGARRALIAGLVTLGLLDVGLAWVQGFAGLLAVRCAQGVAMPMVLSALLSSLDRQATPQAALGLSATYVMGTISGGIIGRLLPSTLVPLVGWQTAFLTLALLHAAAVALAWAGLQERPARAAIIAAGTENATDAPSTTPHTAIPQTALPWMAVCVGGFALLFSQIAVFTAVAFRLADPPFGWSTAALGCLYLVFLPSLALVHGARRMVTALGHARAVTLAGLGGWAGLALTLGATTATTAATTAIIVGLALFSTAVFIIQAVLAHALSLCRTGSSARASGGYLFFYYGGGSLGALAAALVWPPFGWAGCLILIATVQLAAMALTLALRSLGRPHPHPPHPR
ncbi:MFS transporter [Azospirillum griseum]|uniref:MFS transporter n=1 Tax=Azospirillum griseum TaxID=2496639 RepID=A0A431VCQ5_9PROT|nr:MFS transporter [Azospirillum griseum]RTR16761.1 MFS transporter [Azospirillum griseum]